MARNAGWKSLLPRIMRAKMRWHCLSFGQLDTEERKMADMKSCRTRRTGRSTLLPRLASHIRDWPGFWAKVLAGAHRDDPGKRIWELLSDDAKQTVLSASRRGRMSRDEKRTIVKALVAVLSRADFYDESYFGGVALDEEVETALALPHDDRDSQRSYWVNRAILRRCYPDEIVDSCALRWVRRSLRPKRSDRDSSAANAAISRVSLRLGFAVLAFPFVMLIAGLVAPQWWSLLDTKGLVIVTWFGLLAACVVADRLLDDCQAMRRAAAGALSKVDRLKSDGSSSASVP